MQQVGQLPLQMYAQQVFPVPMAVPMTQASFTAAGGRQSACQPAPRPAMHAAPVFDQQRYEQLSRDMDPESGDLARRASAVKALAGRARELALEPAGCRLLQTAMEVDPRNAAGLVEELHGFVSELARSPHGNHVLQKVIE